MRIRIVDIPPEGREFEFDLDRAAVNERVQLTKGLPESTTPERLAEVAGQPTYTFTADPHVDLRLDLEGTTVVVKGAVEGEFVGACARCAEDARQPLEADINLILKPRTSRSDADVSGDEDLNFGYYDNEEVECQGFSEEFLVLGLPFTVLCKPDCRGLCAQCGKNLNDGPCKCPPEQKGDPRFEILRQLKIQ